MKKYKHLNKLVRLEIEILLNRRYKASEIANALGVHPSTIYRELKRNKVGGQYRALKAHHKYYKRRKYCKYQLMSIIRDMKLREYIDTKLIIDNWSPEQIAGRLALESGLERISSPSIYKYIRSVYGRQLEYELKLAKTKRKKKSQLQVSKLEDRVFIDTRPEAANTRSQYGHWEADFIVSGKNYGNTSLLVIHERVSRFTYIFKIKARTIKSIEDTLVRATKSLGPFKSLTLDNDIAFRKHVRLSELINSPIFFTNPYHSWEKGGVENANRYIRRFIPKGADISQYTDRQIIEIQNKINNTPRKILGFQTASEVFNEYRDQALKELRKGLS